METDQMHYTRYCQRPIKIKSSAQANTNFLMEAKPDVAPLSFVACTINCFWMEAMNCNWRKCLSMTIVKPEALVVQLTVSGWKQFRSTKELLFRPDTNRPEALVVQLTVSGWKQIRSTTELLFRLDTNYQ
jgi:hypothetical protein